MRQAQMALMVILLMSCKKEAHNEPSCNGIPINDFSKYLIKPSDTFFHIPCCSPTNPNEIFYGREDLVFNGFQLSYFNFKTHSRKFFNLGFVGRPSVSSTGWIAFTGSDLRLWKIKTNGDSLQLLTKNAEDEQYPAWSSDGKKLVYRHTSLPFNKEVMVNADGTGMRTIDSTGIYVSPS